MTRQKNYLLVGLIVILLFVAYSGIFIYKTLLYKHYDRMDAFGNKRQYFFNQYYKAHGQFTYTIEQLKSFITQNPENFVGNTMAEYITEHNNVNLINRDSDSIIQVYTFGYNFRDNHLLTVNEHFSEVNFLTYLFTKGDILLFYGSKDTSQILNREVKLDTNVTIPSNINLDIKK